MVNRNCFIKYPLERPGFLTIGGTQFGACETTEHIRRSNSIRSPHTMKSGPRPHPGEEKLIRPRGKEFVDGRYVPNNVLTVSVVVLQHEVPLLYVESPPGHGDGDGELQGGHDGELRGGHDGEFLHEMEDEIVKAGK